MPRWDESEEDGIAYIKYNNGRFFFNAELDFARFEHRVQPGLDPTMNGGAIQDATGRGNVYQKVDTECWNWMTELGLLCGPSKLSFIYAYLNGPDWRNGLWISKSAWENIAYGNVNSNVPLFYPYTYLFGYTYASGLDMKDAMGGGAVTACTAVGTRLDYAIAANLNWYGSFFWAWRLGGFPWGVLTQNAGATTYGVQGLASFSTGLDGANANGVLLNNTTGGFNAVNLYGYANTTSFAQAGANTANIVPSIPDNNLGWEVTTGVDWKLLEGLVLNIRGAYWQPGEWFKFACVDRTMATALNGTRIATTPGLLPYPGTAGLAVNPSKSIDPIWAFSGILNVDF